MSQSLFDSNQPTNADQPMPPVPPTSPYQAPQPPGSVSEGVLTASTRLSLRLRWQRLSRMMKIVVGCGGLFGVGSLCSCLGLIILVIISNALPNSNSPVGFGASASATSTRISDAIATPATTQTPTAIPLSTSTPAARPTATPGGTVAFVIGPTFGGPQSAWNAKFGPDDQNTWHINNVNILVQYDTGVDGKPHVYDIQVGLDTAATYWTLAQAETYCHQFLPTDAKFKSHTTDAKGEPQDLYSSTLVANTWLSNAAFGYDPTGEFTISYSPVGSTNQYIGCWVELPS